MCTPKSLVTVEGFTSFPSNITGGKVDILLVSCGTPTKMSFVLSGLICRFTNRFHNCQWSVCWILTPLVCTVYVLLSQYRSHNKNAQTYVYAMKLRRNYISFLRVWSSDLYWENKMYQPNRSTVYPLEQLIVHSHFLLAITMLQYNLYNDNDTAANN